MPGAHHNLKANYSISTNEGFARLSRMAGKSYEWPPPNSGNVNEGIMIDAVYGGAADPDVPGEYAVYSIDWLEEHPEEAEDLARSTDAQRAEEADLPEEAQRVEGEPVEDFAQRLNDLFPGWVYNQERDEVYVLKQHKL